MDAQSIRSKASQDTLFSLLELDPSPIESPTLKGSDKDLPPLPEEAEDAATTTRKPPATNTSGVGLGHHGHGAIYYCTFFLLFLGNALVAANPPVK